MACASGIASSNSILVSIRTAFERATASFSAPIDFAFLFVSGEGVGEKGDEILEFWNDLAPSVPIFGGSSEGVIGTRIELEGQCAASVLLVSGFTERPEICELECIKTPDGPSVMGVSDALLESSKNGVLLFACPVSFSMELLASVLGYERVQDGDPIIPILGGYCSSQDWHRPNLLFCGDRALVRGGVAMTLPKGWRWRLQSSQGCRPVGKPYVITAMEGQTILELGGKPATKQLQSMYNSLPVREQQMVSNTLILGRAVSKLDRTFSHGNFLVRAVQGIDSSNQGLVVTDRFEVGQTIRFHIQDPEAATADLRSVLARPSNRKFQPEAAIMVSCNGRGSRMFSTMNHDASVLDEYFPSLPTAGIFAAGEFSPLLNDNQVHGFSAVVNFLGQDGELVV